MAHGDIIGTAGGETVSYTLLDTAGGLTDGAWVDCGSYGTGQVTVEISTTATVELCAFNANTRPPNTTHGVPIQSGITATTAITIAVLPLYLKARVTAFTGGTVIVRCVLRSL